MELERIIVLEDIIGKLNAQKCFICSDTVFIETLILLLKEYKCIIEKSLSAGELLLLDAIRKMLQEE